VYIWEKRNVYRILVGKYNGNVREGNIKMDLKEIGCESMHWIHLRKDRASDGLL
jgi:hypothetical protein